MSKIYEILKGDNPVYYKVIHSPVWFERDRGEIIVKMKGGCVVNTDPCNGCLGSSSGYCINDLVRLGVLEELKE